VGYFEHLGRVSGSQEVPIDFTSAQLNLENMIASVQLESTI
jgi:hypothetical protein